MDSKNGLNVICSFVCHKVYLSLPTNLQFCRRNILTCRFINSEYNLIVVCDSMYHNVIYIYTTLFCNFGFANTLQFVFFSQSPGVTFSSSYFSLSESTTLSRSSSASFLDGLSLFADLVSVSPSVARVSPS